MQRTLSITVDGKKVVSKPFTFEDLRRIHEESLNPDSRSVFTAVEDAVDHMFEGTEATQEVLERETVLKGQMCLKVHEWYREDITKIMEKNG